MKRQLMLEAWNEWSHKFMPQNAPEIQRREMRRAFYAGAEILYFKVILSFTTGQEPTEKDVRMLDDVLQEIRRFNAQQGAMGINFTTKSGQKT